MLNTFLGLAVVVLVTLARPANSVVWPTTPLALVAHAAAL
jgi:hypothetical protein